MAPFIDCQFVANRSADRMAEETKTEVEGMILGTKKGDCREANKIN
jgi:hypothetical protein